MAQESVVGRLSRLGAKSEGIFRGRRAVELGVSRKQLAALSAAGVIERVHPDTYRMTAVPPTDEQRLRAALVWAGREAAAAERSAGRGYGLEGVQAPIPEIVVPRSTRVRADRVLVRTASNPASSMIRQHRGFPVTGVEATLVAVAAVLAPEELEIACEDARRRRLTSIPALRTYLDRYGKAGRPGVGATRRLLTDLDPRHPSRSTLEVKARRLLLANGITEFVRELPLEWNGRTYHFDFGFPRTRTILETNGRRWHDDPADYEHDNEKWSVPGRHGYRIVFATWAKITRRPHQLLHELGTTMAA